MFEERGRPSKLEQIEIQTKIRPYFERAVSASYAAKNTGFNIKTVCTYFDKWSKEIREPIEKDFLSRQQEQRERLVLGYDDLIFKEYQILDNINEAIKNYKEKEIPKHLVDLFQNIVKSISSLIEKKGLFVIQPVPDEVIEQKVEDVIEKYDLK